MTRHKNRPQTPQEGSPSALRHNVVEQVRSSNRLIETLRNELAACRRRNTTLAKEQQETLRTLARMSWVRDQVADARQEQAAVRVRERQARRGLDRLQQENQELRQRCSALEQALEARNHELDVALQETRCFEELVSELQAIIELLDQQLRLSESKKPKFGGAKK